MEDMMKALIQTVNQSTQTTKKFMQQTDQAIQLNNKDIQELKNELRDLKNFTHQAMSKMEGQIGQLANQVGERERGKFPSKLVPNAKGQFVIGNSFTSIHGQEHVKAITTLRSGKQVDNQVAKPKEDIETAKEE